MILWEESSAGLIEKLNWDNILSYVRDHSPDKLSEILLMVVDEDAHLEWLGLGGRWDIAKEAAERVIKYILLKQKVRVFFREKEVYIPKPSRALKLMSFDLMMFPLDTKEDVILGIMVLFDGESFSTSKAFKEYYKVSGDYTVLQEELARKLDEGYVLLVYDIDRVRENLHNLGLIYLAALLSGLIKMGKVLDVKREFEYIFGEKDLPLEEVVKGIGWKLKYGIGDITIEYNRSLSKIRTLPYSRWLSYTRYLVTKTEEYLYELTKYIYQLHLVAENIRK